MRARRGRGAVEALPRWDGRRSYPGAVEKSNSPWNALKIAGSRSMPRAGADAIRRLDLSFHARLQTWKSMDRAGRNEADIQAPQPQAGQQARVSRPDEDARRSQGAQSASSQRSCAARREGRGEVAGDSPSRGERFPREARIRHSAEIRALLERGKRRRTKNLDVFHAASPASHSRLGVIVPKHGRRIVDRNLLKRRLREIGRRDVLPRLAEVGAGIDVLVRARRGAHGVAYEVLRRELLETLETMWSQSS
jgi:ribonuclease P protein component